MKITKRLSDFFDSRNKKKIEKKVRKSLIKKYLYDLEVELCLEQWIIKRILDGQTERRKELAEKQARIKEIRLFIDYFKQL